MSEGPHRIGVAALSAVLAVGLWSASASAQTIYNVEANELVGARPGMALVTLSADARSDAWLSADALVWTGFEDNLEGDALVMAIRAKDREGRGDMKLGRFILVSGALRPLHIDGGHGRAHLPWGLTVEVFGGVPVKPVGQARSFDWAAGTRVSRRLGDWGSAGLAFRHQREGGTLADEELGLDAGGAVTDWLSLNGMLTWDLINPGISEMRTAAVTRGEGWRLEAFQLRRSPARIMPATSLFSMLGDTTSQRFGLSGQWSAAPRLDVGGTTAVQLIGSDPFEALTARAVLRLDPLGESVTGLVARREGAPEGGWTGVRGYLDQALAPDLRCATEVEVAFADEPDGRGTLWPWGSLSLTWEMRPTWEVAAAVQASATPQYAGRLDGFLRLTHRMGTLQ